MLLVKSYSLSVFKHIFMCKLIILQGLVRAPLVPNF